MRKHIATLLLLASIMSCKSSTDSSTPTTSTNAADSATVRKTYDAAAGGVQIVAIQPDQSNSIGDEWIVLQTDHPVSLVGWTLNAGDNGQDYNLFSTITDTLLIYTHADQNRLGFRDTGLNLSSGKFIWNNTVPDTARLFDASSNLKSVFTYN
jgi:hypothetical protein